MQQKILLKKSIKKQKVNEMDQVKAFLLRHKNPIRLYGGAFLYFIFILNGRRLVTRELGS